MSASVPTVEHARVVFELGRNELIVLKLRGALRGFAKRVADAEKSAWGQMLAADLRAAAELDASDC